MTDRIRVHVRYHAAARELAGCSEESVDLDEGTRAALRRAIGARHPALAPRMDRMRLARNGELVDDRAHEDRLEPDDELDVLPPVAGGASGVLLAEVRETPPSVDEVLAAVAWPGAGALCLFVGVVRDEAGGKPVSRLDYEAHPTLAPLQLRRELDEVARRWPSVRLAAVHRVGSLSVGDLAVVIAVAAPHRAEAFDACREAIERIKQTVPIWKKEWGPDGSAHWVNLDG
ncbi:MAG: molybdenum cofactor biosynthesis protein MoaE [Myxococcota bacterium]|nr:molybdenum cofactor biosynthesis protein MoaE [Myxococcota bacterium]MDW8362706.1 molybdenum cofactor biosynthesis protein MoaE [Myxococcales bacterium]